MIIELDEKDIFAFNTEENSIYIFRHKDGRFEGDVSKIGKIKFFDMRQANQFGEMIELMESDSR